MSPNLHEILIVFEQLSAFGRDLTLNLWAKNIWHVYQYSKTCAIRTP
jgi:hypothetical protein